MMMTQKYTKKTGLTKNKLDCVRIRNQILPLETSHGCLGGDTVDGRNPKQPPGMFLKPVNNGMSTYVNYQPQLDFTGFLFTINSIL